MYIKSLILYNSRVIIKYKSILRDAMKSRELIKRIQADGWYLIRITGSHHHFKHDKKLGLVTIPHPKKDLPKGTVKSILKQAGLA